MTPLTDRHIKVLRFIKDYHKRHGYMPSMRNIADFLGAESTSYVTYLLDGLEMSGLITRQAKVARSINITQQGREQLGG